MIIISKMSNWTPLQTLLLITCSALPFTGATAPSLAGEAQPHTPPQVALTTVEQLSDVAPTDWAYQALENLIERYNCLSGYPDGTFRGNSPLSRYEFAASLNACLSTLPRFEEAVTSREWETLQRLREEFADELALLSEQVNTLETRTQALEANTFSTTTKFSGRIVFSAEQLAGERADNNPQSLPDSLTFTNRVRLNFDSSFTGQDLLKVRLDALNPPFLNVPTTGTNMTRLSFDRNTNNNVVIGKFFYRFPVSDNLSLHIDPIRGAYQANVSSTFNPALPDPVAGAITRFGRFNPIYYQGSPGTGLTGVYRFGSNGSLSLGYLARGGSAANAEEGLFGGGYTALGQIDLRPAKRWRVGLTYAHSYYPAGTVAVSAATGSRLANAPFGNGVATTADHVGVQSTVKLGSQVNLSGWTGWSFADAESSGGQATVGDTATTFNWALTLGLPNLGGEGNLGGLIVGQPPKVTSNTGGATDGSSAWHLETFYRYRVNENVSLIPGFFVILNPEHNSANDPIWLGSVRAVFRF
ncbi:iron uptake porin [Spirulina sp. CS-785/01]|uniref:iron uptake porin n=1 Tax=Spirulina sp. CS-785/01 TaxID=3021716 RepID=UPI00232FF7A5|nr:iron uptake porin [Spirulina sp. CS-785/01]MDB9313276.1 iron uptake porin [Spirulina sp. CS-785/01]